MSTFQIIGKNDKRENCYDREILLGCVRIDEPNLVRSHQEKRFAFYAFMGYEKGSNETTNCVARGNLIVVTGDYTHTPEKERENRDVLFLFKEKTSRFHSVWKFIKPGHNGLSETGTVVWGTETLDQLMTLLSEQN